MIILTPKNIHLLRTILRYANHYHTWPSKQDLANALHKDRETIGEMLRRLRAMGYVTLNYRGTESGWPLTPKALELLNAQPPAISSTAPSRFFRNRPARQAVKTKQRLLQARIKAAGYDLQHTKDPISSLDIVG